MRESTFWMLHLLAAVFLIFLLGFHMILMHLNGILLFMGFSIRDVLSFSEVVARGRHIGYFIVYVGLLLFALYHSFYGLRSMLYELNLRKTGERLVAWLLVIIGIGLFVFGTYVAYLALNLPQQG